jgi:hypothetical protein
MRRFVFALILALSAISTAAAQGKDHKKQHDLLGPVKTVESGRIEYTINDGESVPGRRLPNQKLTFNEAGDKTEEISYDQSGAMTSKTVYAYDREGRLQGYDSYSSIVDKTFSKPQKNAYKLDDKGNVLEYVNYQSDGSLGNRFIYRYDAKGNKLEEAFYAWNGTRTGKLLNTYDEAGRILSQASYNMDDSVAWKSAYVYNAKGQKVEATQYIAGNLRYRVTFNYDDRNRLVEQMTLEFNKTPGLRSSHAPEPGKIIYSYDDRERTKEVTTYKEDGTLKDRWIYQLDERGQETGLKIFNADGSPKYTEIFWYDNGRLLRKLSGIQMAKYEYDSKGNWIKKVMMIQPPGAAEPEVYTVEYRDITYY